ncbi:hypothetical protein ABH978_003713 [Bradyrhizobium ottawaense]
MAEPGRDDQRARRSATPGLVDDTGNLARRRGDDHELGHEVQAVQALHRRDAADFGMAWIDQAEPPLEFGLVNVLQNGASD